MNKKFFDINSVNCEKVLIDIWPDIKEIIESVPQKLNLINKSPNQVLQHLMELLSELEPLQIALAFDHSNEKHCIVKYQPQETQHDFYMFPIDNLLYSCEKNKTVYDLVCRCIKSYDEYYSLKISDIIDVELDILEQEKDMFEAEEENVDNEEYQTMKLCLEEYKSNESSTSQHLDYIQKSNFISLEELEIVYPKIKKKYAKFTKAIQFIDTLIHNLTTYRFSLYDLSIEEGEEQESIDIISTKLDHTAFIYSDDDYLKTRIDQSLQSKWEDLGYLPMFCSIQKINEEPIDIGLNQFLNNVSDAIFDN